MNVLLKFKETQHINVQSVAVLGSFNDFDASKGIMQKQGDEWRYETDLTTGEHHYKFLINNELLLNDPYANMYEVDDEEEIWSVILINEHKERLYNPTEYTVHISDYWLTNQVSDTGKQIHKRLFAIDIDRQVVAQFVFHQITGVHPVTIVWYAPEGTIYQVSESLLFADDANEQVQMWFWLDVHEKDRQKILGNWTIKLFIDGDYILEDRFSISKMGIYAANGKMINR